MTNGHADGLAAATKRRIIDETMRNPPSSIFSFQSPMIVFFGFEQCLGMRRRLA
jgi:hypothetical protein